MLIPRTKRSGGRGCSEEKRSGKRTFRSGGPRAGGVEHHPLCVRFAPRHQRDRFGRGRSVRSVTSQVVGFRQTAGAHRLRASEGVQKWGFRPVRTSSDAASVAIGELSTCWEKPAIWSPGRLYR